MWCKACWLVNLAPKLRMLLHRVLQEVCSKHVADQAVQAPPPGWTGASKHLSHQRTDLGWRGTRGTSGTPWLEDAAEVSRGSVGVTARLFRRRDWASCCLSSEIFLSYHSCTDLSLSVSLSSVSALSAVTPTFGCKSGGLGTRKPRTSDARHLPLCRTFPGSVLRSSFSFALSFNCGFNKGAHRRGRGARSASASSGGVKTFACTVSAPLTNTLPGAGVAS